MKVLATLKWPILLFCFGAVLALSPVCKAQSEVAPDHFDGPNTKPLEKPSDVAGADVKVDRASPVATQGEARKTRTAQSLQLASVHETPTPNGQNAAPIDNKRKAATAKSKKQ